ncbi:MAG: hypothetical protein QXT77_01245 [Candidatus Methanomethylicaceae archaeon]
MVRKDVQAKLIGTKEAPVGNIPTRRSLATGDEMSIFPPRSYKIFYESLVKFPAKPVPAPVAFTRVEEIWLRYVSAILANEMSAEEGCMKAHKEIADVLGGSNSPVPGQGLAKGDICVLRLGKNTLVKRENLAGCLFVLPTFLGFLFFVLSPMVAALVLSFYSWDLFTPPKFTGLSNYRALMHDEHLLDVYRNTLVLVGGLDKS